MRKANKKLIGTFYKKVKSLLRELSNGRCHGLYSKKPCVFLLRLTGGTQICCKPEAMMSCVKRRTCIIYRNHKDTVGTKMIEKPSRKQIFIRWALLDRSRGDSLNDGTIWYATRSLARINNGHPRHKIVKVKVVTEIMTGR